jgi:hypothetical protein
VQPYPGGRGCAPVRPSAGHRRSACRRLWR